MELWAIKSTKYNDYLYNQSVAESFLRDYCFGDLKDKRLWIFDDNEEAEDIIEIIGMQDLEVVKIEIKELEEKK